MFKLHKIKHETLQQVKYGAAKRILPRIQWYVLALILCLPLLYWVGLIIYQNFYPHAEGVVMSKEFAVNSPVDAFVRQVYVEQGQPVKQQQKIMLLYSPEVESEITLLNTQLDVLKHQKNVYVNAEIVKLLQMKQLAKIQIKNSQTYLNYITSYRKIGAVSLLQVHDAQMQLTTAQQNYSLILSQIEQSQKTFAVNQVQIFNNNINDLERQLQTKNQLLEVMKIYAPSNGSMKSLIAHEGEYVVKNSPLAIVSSDRSFRIVAFVDTKFIKNIKVGNYVKIILPNKDIVSGNVTRLPASADQIYKGIDLIHEADSQKPIVIIKPAPDFPKEYKINGIHVEVLL